MCLPILKLWNNSVTHQLSMAYGTECFGCTYARACQLTHIQTNIGWINTHINHRDINYNVFLYVQQNCCEQILYIQYTVQLYVLCVCVCVYSFPHIPVHLSHSKYHVTSCPRKTPSPETRQKGPLVHTSIINKTNTPHWVREKLNTISCFCWICCTRLVGSIISLHIVVPVKLQCIKT